MKSLGLNPSIEEVKELMKEVDPKGKGDINLAGKVFPPHLMTPPARRRLHVN